MHNLTKPDPRDVPLTIEQLKSIMPKRMKQNITPSLVNNLNSVASDPESRDVFRENFIGYTSVLMDPNVNLQHYIDAVKYVSFKLLGYNNRESWERAFPDRMQRMIDDARDDQFIRSTVACYNRNKTVNKVLEQTLVPTYILNHDVFQKAINTQAALMANPSVSDKVRSDAANSLLTHLKVPEATKVQLDLSVSHNDDSIRELRDATLELVSEQRKAIKAGQKSAGDVARGKLVIDGDYEVVDD